jgi:Transposase DDE domain
MKSKKAQQKTGKAKQKRWGKKFEDKRNWKEYNEKLVRRGELYLSLEFLENWDNELDKMNEGKKGAPFSYPEQFVTFMAFVYSIFHLPYREMEGFLRKLSDLISRDIAADYTTLFKRIAKMKITLPETISEKREDVIIAVDASGIKVTNRGEWMREKWRVYRGWIKAHIAVDIKTKETLAIEITDESVPDSDEFDELINQTEQNIEGKKIKRTLGDGGYDDKDCFNTLDKKKIESGLKTRINASTKSRGSPYRAKCVREKKELGGYKGWRDKYNYGKRWLSESVLSAVKRIFGETVRATSIVGMKREAKMKFTCYNILLNCV